MRDWFADRPPPSRRRDDVSGVMDVRSPGDAADDLAKQPDTSTVSAPSGRVMDVRPKAPALTRLTAHDLAARQAALPAKGAEKLTSFGRLTPMTPLTSAPGLAPPIGADWEAEEWRAHFEERAAIMEHDGSVACINAQCEAFESCLAELLRVVAWFRDWKR